MGTARCLPRGARVLTPVASARPPQPITSLCPASHRASCLATVRMGSCLFLSSHCHGRPCGARLTQSFARLLWGAHPIPAPTGAHRRGWRGRALLPPPPPSGSGVGPHAASHQRPTRPAKRHHAVRERPKRSAPQPPLCRPGSFFRGPCKSGQSANPRDSDRLLQTSGIRTLDGGGRLLGGGEVRRLHVRGLLGAAPRPSTDAQLCRLRWG